MQKNPYGEPSPQDHSINWRNYRDSCDYGRFDPCDPEPEPKDKSRCVWRIVFGNKSMDVRTPTLTQVRLVKSWLYSRASDYQLVFKPDNLVFDVKGVNHMQHVTCEKLGLDELIEPQDLCDRLVKLVADYVKQL